MAILGGQLVITLVIAFVFQKTASQFSFTKWLLCNAGLVRYLCPEDEYLRTLANLGKEKSKAKHKNASQIFNLPRNVEVDLKTAKVSSSDILCLQYFPECQWLLDFCLCTCVVYIFCEVYAFYGSSSEENYVSLLWCLLAVYFATYPFIIFSMIWKYIRRLLSSFTMMYFKSEKSAGERTLCIVAFFVYLLVSMIILTLDESILETGLEQALIGFIKNVSTYMKDKGLPNPVPMSIIVLKFTIAVLCGMIGSFLTFPGLRMAQMHRDSIRSCKSDKVFQTVLNISFVLPFALIILWIKPIGRDFITKYSVNGKEAFITDHCFESVRLILMIFIILLRFILLPTYIQSYLDIASDRIKSMKKEGGHITNIELKRQVASVYSYLCVVVLQFAAPLVLCFFLTLLYKSLSGFRWLDFSICDDMCLKNAEQSLNTAQTAQISWAGLKKIFSAEVYKGVLGFTTWWCYFCLFATSSLGILYQSYFNQQGISL